MLIPTLLLIAFLLPPDAPKADECSELRIAVERLDADFLEYTTLYEQDLMKEKTYIRKLKRLHKKQQQRYEQARDCNFTNLAEQNWWYRSRLKFPSRIELALKELGE